MSEPTRLHHPFSPSKLEMFEACPAFEPQQSTHHRALAGTKAHTVTETGKDDPELSDVDAAAAAECLHFYETELEEARKHGQVTELTETYFPVERQDPILVPVYDETLRSFSLRSVESLSGGFVDRAILIPALKHAILYDWKFGQWPVSEAMVNLQGWAYAVGIFQRYPEVDSVEVVFKQPALSWVSRHVFHRRQLLDLLLRIRQVVMRKIESNHLGNFSMARPCVPACNFCARLGQCDKVCEIACQIGKKFHPLSVPESVTPTSIRGDSSQAMRLAGVMEVWAGAFKRHVTGEVIANRLPMPEGFKLASRADKEVVDQEKMKQITLQFISPDELASITEFSRTRAEEIIRNNAPRGNKTVAVERYQQQLLSEGALAKKPEYFFLRAAAAKENNASTAEKQ